MNWNDLQSIWERQEPPVEPSGDLAIRNTFETNRRKLAARLFWRDVREAAAGLLSAGYFTYVAWHRGKAYWPVGIAVLLILGVSVFFVLERVRVRRQRLHLDASLLAKLESDIAELRHQRHLLVEVSKWYLAPLVGAVAIIIATDVMNRPAHFATWNMKIFMPCYLVACALLTWGIWKLNQRVARRKIEPLITELEKLRDKVLSPK